MSYPTVADIISFLREQKQRAIESLESHPPENGFTEGYGDLIEFRIHAHQVVINYMASLESPTVDEAVQKTELFIAEQQKEDRLLANFYKAVLAGIHFVVSDTIARP